MGRHAGQSRTRRWSGGGLGLPPGSVKINTVFLGGGFGPARASTASDFMIGRPRRAGARAAGAGETGGTHGDDMRAGHFRPVSVNRVRGGVDAAGKAVALHHAVVGNSVVENWPLKAMMKDGVDLSQMEGSSESPPTRCRTGASRRWSRSSRCRRSSGARSGTRTTASSSTARSTSSPRSAGATRTSCAANCWRTKPRHLAVLEKAATEGGLGQSRCQPGTSTASRCGELRQHRRQVVEASVTDSTTVKVHRVTAVDCGFAVNPQQVVVAQIVIFAGMALYNQITLLQDGVIQQIRHHLPDRAPRGSAADRRAYRRTAGRSAASANRVAAVSRRRWRADLYWRPASASGGCRCRWRWPEAAAQGDAPGTGHDRGVDRRPVHGAASFTGSMRVVDVGAGAGDGAGAADAQRRHQPPGRFIDCASSHRHCRHDRTCGGARATTVDGRATTDVEATERGRTRSMADRPISPPFAVSLADEGGVLPGTAARAAPDGARCSGLEAPPGRPRSRRSPGSPDDVEVLASGTLAATSGPVRNPPAGDRPLPFDLATRGRRPLAYRLRSRRIALRLSRHCTCACACA